MGGINARVFAATYQTALPDEATLRREVLATREALEDRAAGRPTFARGTGLIRNTESKRGP